MRLGLAVGGPVVVLHLDLAVAVLLADVAGGVVGTVTGERGAGGTDNERGGDDGGGGDSTNRHWTLPIGCESPVHRPTLSGATSVDGPTTGAVKS